MSAYPFTIAMDQRRRIIMTTILGYWTLEDAKAFVMQFQIADVQMRKGGHFDTILDVGNAPPLPRDASEYLEAQQGKGRPAHVRKMSYVCPSMLGRLQLRRITMKDKNMGVFTTVDEAHAWLALA